MLPDLIVALIDVGTKLDRAVRTGERRQVDQKHRYRRRQHAAIGGAERDPFVDDLDRLLQQQRGEFARVLHAHAAMALPAVVATEKRLQPRGVEGDNKTVWDPEF